MDKLIDALSLDKTIPCIVIIITAVVIWIAIKRFYRKFLKNSDNGTLKTFSRVTVGLIRFLLILTVILFTLKVYGINITSAVAGLGIASAIVGLALQDFLKDVIMGLHIMLDRFYSIGDCVEYDGKEGIISEFSMKTTKIRLFSDGSYFCICNRNIDKVHRLSDTIEYLIPVPYDIKLGEAEKVMQAVCENILRIDSVEGCTYSGVYSFEESLILHKLKIVCNPRVRADVKPKANREVLLCFEKAGIEIPFNQIDVHMK